jgi:hypothetical protein
MGSPPTHICAGTAVSYCQVVWHVVAVFCAVATVGPALAALGTHGLAHGAATPTDDPVAVDVCPRRHRSTQSHGCPLAGPS